MTYSCTDFTDSVLDALKITVPDESADSPSDQADLALAEIERLQKAAAELALLQQGPKNPEQMVNQAVRLLATARDFLVMAEAPRAADKVRLALSSAKGAQRHARNKTDHTRAAA